MFLRDIELINFKCHKHLKISFVEDEKSNRKTTFIIGENGTGKSALLKAIALVTAGSNALAELLGNPENWIQNKKRFCRIKAIITTVEGLERHIELKIERGQQIREILNANRESLEKLDSAILNAERNYFVLGYGANRRLTRSDTRITSKQYYYSSPRIYGIQSLFNPDATLVSLTNWAMDIDYSSNGADLNIIKKSLNEFLLENVKFKKIDRQKGQLLFSTPDGEIALEQLSDGYQNVASWVGDMMYNITNSFKNYKDPLKARGILLIDEVDLHLHPKWQRRLHIFLEKKLPNFQVIVTTHSPLTAQQAKENELYALTRYNKAIELIAFKGDPSKMLLHQILMSPVFGLETDESVEVEKDKKRVRELSLKKEKTNKEMVEIETLSKKVENLPLNIRSNSTLDPKDAELLKALNMELKVKLQ